MRTVGDGAQPARKLGGVGAPVADGARPAVLVPEVAEILEFPVPLLRESYGRRRLVRRGVPFRTDTYVVGDHLIWGATARILGDLLERLPPELG